MTAPAAWLTTPMPRLLGHRSVHGAEPSNPNAGGVTAPAGARSVPRRRTAP